MFLIGQNYLDANCFLKDWDPIDQKTILFFKINGWPFYPVRRVFMLLSLSDVTTEHTDRMASVSSWTSFT